MSADNSKTPASPQTVTLRDGREVLAKAGYGKQLWPVTYANRTQAHKKLAALGPGWFVADVRRPFLIIKEKTPAS